MASDLDKILRLDISYPGISFGYESWAIETYLDVLDEYMPFAQDQYKLRAGQRLKRESETLTPEEEQDQKWRIEEAANRVIPRFFRSAAVVAVWGLFESFVFDIAQYVKRRETAKLSIRDIRASNFREQTEKYFEGVLKVDLPWSERERLDLGHLQEIRNLIAHRNGRVTDIAPDRQRELEKLLNRVRGVKIESGALDVSSTYVQDAKGLVFDVVSKLNGLIAERYDGPTVPRVET